MSVTKIEESFYEATGHKLSNVSQLKLFSILRDHDGTRFMNIFRSFNVNDKVINNTTYYTMYEVGNDEWWDDISYKVYGTPYLWWIIALTNDIYNPFEDLSDGDFLKILNPNLLYTIFKDIEGISDL